MMVLIRGPERARRSLTPRGDQPCAICAGDIWPFELITEDMPGRKLSIYRDYKPGFCPECGRRLEGARPD